MNVARQLFALTLIAIRGIPQRLTASLVTLVGITVVVAIFVSLLAMGEGAFVWSGKNARADRVVILSHGANIAPLSRLSRENLATIANAPGVKRGADGKPLITGGSMVFVDIVRKTNRRGQIFLVGMSERAVYPEIHLIEGRWYRPGLHEVIVSKAAQQIDKGVEIGDRIPLRGSEWIVVGVFEDSGGVFDQVLFTDGETLLSAFGRDVYQQATVVLDDPLAFERFRTALQQDKTLNVDVYTEMENRENNVGDLRQLLDFVSYFLGGLMGVGGVCAAWSSLYAAVDARRREIATWRVIGFNTLPVLGSILLEAMSLAFVAACAGVIIAWAAVNGMVVSSHGLTFPLAVTFNIAAICVGWALAIGLIAGLAASIRAARVPLHEATRAT